VTGTYCNRCGHRNPDGSNFCSSCGQVLERPADGEPVTTTITLTPVESAGEVADEEITVEIDDLPVGAGMLVVKRGPNAGSRFVLSPDVTSIGRSPESEIFLDDITVSRRHAEVVHQGAAFVVRDVGSLNGTYLNRQRIEETTMANGDELQVGKFRLVFLAEVQRG
jgi:pSer/pThr/pTyr-binding forkhead associated (FHA) protein